MVIVLTSIKLQSMGLKKALLKLGTDHHGTSYESEFKPHKHGREVLLL